MHLKGNKLEFKNKTHKLGGILVLLFLGFEEISNLVGDWNSIQEETVGGSENMHIYIEFNKCLRIDCSAA